LELQARAGRQEWGATTAFPFVIRPPWWATWWCRALAAATALGGIVALWRWRIYALTTRQRELEAIVADRTRQLREQAIKDGLTGLLNRSAFFEVLERELARARREGDRLALVMMDLDHFKSINDTHGHQAGDAVLKETAQRILQSVRSYDTVGRYGGEELAILMPGCGLEEASSRAEYVRRQIAELPFATPAGTVNVTASFGVTVTGPGCDGIHELLQAADQALYAAKANGRNCVVAGRSVSAQREETAESFAPDVLVR
jgi:diguanylate cyclase (GGDEF)-like protein